MKNEEHITQLKEVELFLKALSSISISNHEANRNYTRYRRSVSDAVILITDLQNKVDQMHACMTTLIHELDMNERELLQLASKSGVNREPILHQALGVRNSKEAAIRIFNDEGHSESECGQALELVQDIIALIASQSEDVTYESVVKFLSTSIDQRKKIEEWLTRLEAATCFRTDNEGVMKILLDCISQSS